MSCDWNTDWVGGVAVAVGAEVGAAEAGSGLEPEKPPPWRWDRTV